MAGFESNDSMESRFTYTYKDPVVTITNPDSKESMTGTVSGSSMTFAGMGYGGQGHGVPEK